jgi:hypothetical protein
MNTFLVSAKLFARRFAERVPREHGFWVMVSAVAVAAFLRNPGWGSIFVGVTMVLVAAWAGGEVRARVRREGRLQLASSVVLASAGIPIELAGGARGVDAFANALAWVVVFGTFTLCVWAGTARSSRVRRPEVAALTLLSFFVPLAGAAAFAFAERRAPALATMASAVASVAFAIWQPGAKQMKAMGLSLAGAAAFVGLVLAIV